VILRLSTRSNGSFRDECKRRNYIDYSNFDIGLHVTGSTHLFVVTRNCTARPVTWATNSVGSVHLGVRAVLARDRTDSSVLLDSVTLYCTYKDKWSE